MGISIVSLYKHYKNGANVTEVLKNISLEVNDGDFIAIIGPSGSGKSTLMNIIGCLDRPTSGRCILNGKDITRLPDDKLAKIRNKQIGFVFQSFNLLPQYTALENVELPMLYSRIPFNKARSRAKEVLKSLGMEDRLNHKPSQLSGGQKQRVAIARAIINQPTVILADEPTGNLDSQTGSEVMEIFQKLNRRGKTLIVVTHDLDIASKARRVINIRDGVIKEVAH